VLSIDDCDALFGIVIGKDNSHTSRDPMALSSIENIALAVNIEWMGGYILP